MSIQDARRPIFEKWWPTQGEFCDVVRYQDGEYVGEDTRNAWQVWNGALDSVEIDLPDWTGFDVPSFAVEPINACREAIEAAGVKVKK